MVHASRLPLRPSASALASALEPFTPKLNLRHVSLAALHLSSRGCFHESGIISDCIVSAPDSPSQADCAAVHLQPSITS